MKTIHKIIVEDSGRMREVGYRIFSGEKQEKHLAVFPDSEAVT